MEKRPDIAASAPLRPRRDYIAGLMDLVLLIAARIGANLLALIWTVLLTRLMQPDLSGIAFQAIAIAQILSIGLTLNVESGAMRALVPALQQGRVDQAAGFIRFNRRLIAVTLPALAALAAIWQGAFAPPGTGWLTCWVILGAAMVALARMTGRHATALGVMRKGLLPRLLTAPIVMGAGLLLAAASGVDLRPWQIAALYALSEALTVLIQNLLLRRSLARFQGPARVTDRAQWITLGLWLTPGVMMSEYRKSLLIAAAALALAPAQISQLAVAFSIVNLISFGVVAVDIAFSPRVAGAMAAGDAIRRDRLLAISGAIKLAGLGLGTLLVMGLGHWALGWFGAEYVSAWPALLILLLLPAVSVLFGPGSVILTAQGQGRADFTGNMLGTVAMIGAIGAGGALSGLTGAAVGAVIGQIVAQATMAGLCWRRLGVDPTLGSLRHLQRALPAHEAVT